MQLNLVQSTQSDDNAMRDRVTACMETGNHGQARTLLNEVHDVNPTLADSIHMDVLAEYGMAL